MTKRRILILGGGITGLALAYFLERDHSDAVEVTLVESSDRLGGWIRTDRPDGFHMERGPHSLRVKGSGAATLLLVKELGLESEIVWPAPSAQRKYLLFNGRLVEMPRSPLGLLVNGMSRCLLHAAVRERKKPPLEEPDESIHSFFSRRFSKTVAERFADPITTGIFAGDPKGLSIRSCFPQAFEWEQQYGSVVRGLLRARGTGTKLPGAMFSLRRGLETLPKTLATKIQGRLLCNCTAANVLRKATCLAVETDQGALEADQVISTLPAPALARLVTGSNTDTATLLRGIPYASVALVSIAYNRPVLRREGFGYLVPSGEGEQVMGVIFDSSVFTPLKQRAGETRVTVMLGGVRRPELLDLPDSLLEQLALRALERHLDLRDKPDLVSVFRANDAIPQYLVGHEARMQTVRRALATSLPGLTVAGACVDGAGIGDRLRQAEKIAASAAVLHKPKVSDCGGLCGQR